MANNDSHEIDHDYEYVYNGEEDDTKKVSNKYILSVIIIKAKICLLCMIYTKRKILLRSKWSALCEFFKVIFEK